MCLSTVDKIYDKNDKTEGHGWKIVNKLDNKRFNFLHFPQQKSQLFNKWLKRNKVRTITATNRTNYNSGFHIYKTRDAARSHYNGYYGKIVKVLYKGIVCSGKQTIGYENPKECLVVQQIMVIQ
jgi:hypothetical protein